MVNQEDYVGQSISERMFSKSALFIGSEPIHSYGLDLYQGIFFPRELKEKERRRTAQSPNRTDPESLIVITKRIAYIINSKDSHSGKDIIKDLNSIYILSVYSLIL